MTAGPTEATKVPDNLSDVEAAAVPVAYVAAQLALMNGVRFEPGMTLLIPGVGGSVGNAAIQLARVHGAGRVITSAGRTEKAEKARSPRLRRRHRPREGIAQRGRDASDRRQGRGRALDSIGGSITGEALKSVGAGGRVIKMGYPAGTDLRVNSLTLIWRRSGPAGRRASRASTSTSSPPRHTRPPGRRSCRSSPNGTVKPAIDRTYPLEEAGEATRHLIEDRPFGKVVLTI